MNSTPSSCRHRIAISAPLSWGPVSATGGRRSSIAKALYIGMFRGEPRSVSVGRELVKPQWSKKSDAGAPAHGKAFATIRAQRRALVRHCGDPLATRKELSDFLASVERRAFKQCVF